MKEFFTRKNLMRFWPVVVIAVAGALAGYLYYRYVGCVTGTCAITSNPYRSTLWGAVMGFLIGQIVMPGKPKAAATPADDGKDIEKSAR